jgi:hypothetical protein
MERTKKSFTNVYVDRPLRAGSEDDDLTDERCELCGTWLASDEVECGETWCWVCNGECGKVFNPNV